MNISWFPNAKKWWSPLCNISKYFLTRLIQPLLLFLKIQPTLECCSAGILLYTQDNEPTRITCSWICLSSIISYSASTPPPSRPPNSILELEIILERRILISPHHMLPTQSQRVVARHRKWQRGRRRMRKRRNCRGRKRANKSDFLIQLRSWARIMPERVIISFDRSSRGVSCFLASSKSPFSFRCCCEGH